MAIKRDCDICKSQGTITPATYDAKTNRGPWAYMCDEHMETHAHKGFLKAATKLSEAKGAD